MSLPPEAMAIPQRLLENASLLSDRYQLLALLLKNAVFAEVGVALGDWSEAVISNCQPSLFIAIDDFRLHELPSFWGRPVEEVFAGRTHSQAYRERFATAIAAQKVRVLQGDSVGSLEQLEDRSVDIIYLDADHRYGSVSRELDVAHRKVRENGWIIINDYIMVPGLNHETCYGVVHATNEFMIKNDWGLQYLALQTRMFCDVALRPTRFLQQAQAVSAHLALENQRLHQELEALRSSTSWLMTAPLRSVSDVGRKMRRSIRSGVA